MASHRARQTDANAVTESFNGRLRKELPWGSIPLHHQARLAQMMFGLCVRPMGLRSDAVVRYTGIF